MTKSKENLAAAQRLIKTILTKNFKQKIDADALRAVAEKMLAAVPSVHSGTNKRAA